MMMIPRSCGECTLCCTVTAVPELKKAAGTKCVHCTTNCTIYETRPESCRKFECAWLSGEMPEDMRPDKVRVVIEKLPVVRIVLALAEPHHPEWLTPYVDSVLKEEYQDKGIAVVASGGMALIPDGMSAESIRRDLQKAATILGL